MLSKNNRKEYFQKQEPKKQRFAIKKLTVGVASVLIGFTFMGVNAANADTSVPTNPSASAVSQPANGTKSGSSVALSTNEATDKITPALPASDSSANEKAATSAKAAASNKDSQVSDHANSNAPQSSANNTTEKNNASQEHTVSTADIPKNVANPSVASLTENKVATTSDNEQANVQNQDVSDYSSFLSALRDKNVNQITLTQNVSFAGAKLKSGPLNGVSGNWEQLNNSGIARALTIEGNNHTLDMADRSIGFQGANQNDGKNWNITFKDLTLNVTKSPSDNGPFAFNSAKKGNTLTYDNVTINADEGPIVPSGNVASVTFNNVTANVNKGALIDSNDTDVILSGRNSIVTKDVGSSATFTAKTLKVIDGNTYISNATSIKPGTTGGQAIGRNTIWVNPQKQGDSLYVADGANLTIDAKSTDLRGIVTSDYKTGTITIDGNLTENMQDGHSSAITTGNLNIGKSGNVTITTHQDNEADGFENSWANGNTTYNGFHYGVVNLGVGVRGTAGSSTASLINSGTLKITRPSVPANNTADGKSFAPIIVFGTAGAEIGNKFNLTVNEGATLDIQDAAQMVKPIVVTGATPYENSPYFGLINMFGVSGTNALTFTKPAYINLQRTGAQAGTLLRLEATNNTIDLNGVTPGGSPLSQWDQGNHTDNPSASWRLITLEGHSAASNDAIKGFAPLKKNGKASRQLLNSNSSIWLSMDKTGKVSYRRTSTGDIVKPENGTIPEEVQLNNFLNNFNFWTPQRISFGSKATIINPAYNPVDVKQGTTATDKPAYLETVQQGTDANKVTYSKATDTPAWVGVAADGTLTLAPTTDTALGMYNIPVMVTNTDESDAGKTINNTVFAPVLVTNGNQKATWTKDKDGNYTGALVVTTDPEALNAHETTKNSSVFNASDAVSKIEEYQMDTYDTFTTKPTEIKKDATGISISWSKAPSTVVPTATAEETIQGAVDVKFGTDSQPFTDKVLGQDTDTPEAYTSTSDIKIPALGATVVDPAKPVDAKNIKAGDALTDAQKALISTKIPEKEIVSETWATQPVKGKDATIRLTFTDKDANGQPTYLDLVVPAKDLSISSDAEEYTPVAKPVSTPQGTVPDAENGIKNTSDMPEGTKYTWSTAPDVTKPGKVPATVVVTYPDGSTDDVPTTVTIDAKPVVKPIQTTMGKVPEASKGVTNINNGGTKPVDGYPESVTWTKEPDVSKVGPSVGTATVTYPDGTTQTVNIPVAVDDPTHVTIIDDQGHSFELNADNVITHKTTDKNIIGNPVVNNFELSYYEGGQDYSKPFIYTLDGDVYKLTQVGDMPTATTTAKAAAYPESIPVSEISAIWTPKGEEIGIPGVTGQGTPSSVASKANGGTATIKYTGQLHTQGTDYVYPMYPATIDASKVNWPIFGFGPSDSHAFPSVFIYGAQANGTIPSVYQNTKDLEKDLGDAAKLVDESDLTKENNAEVTSTTWKTLPSLDKANAKAPATVEITFKDGTHLDIPVNVNVIGVDNGNTDTKNHDVYRDITRTITVEGEKEPVVQHVIYSRIKTTNLAKPEGQQVSYTEWAPAVDNSGKPVTNFPEFNVTKPGYTAKATGATIETIDGKQYVPASATITPDSKNEVVNVAYTANDHTLVITYVDKDTGKQVGKAYDVTGKTGEEVKVDVASHVPTNWTLVPGQKVISSETFGSNDPAAVSYKVEHKTENVPVNKNDKDTYKVITQIITEVKDGKDSQLSKLELPFQRTGVKDLVTNKITWNAWVGPQGSKDVNGVSTYTVPAYTKLSQPGYVVSSITINGAKSNDIPAWNVTGDSTDQNVVVTYEAAEHKQVINFVNNADLSQVVGTYEVPGKTGQTVTADVAGHVPTNWQLVPGQQVASSITFGTDNPATLTYKVEHKTENVPVNKNDKNTYREITQTIVSVDPTTGKETTVKTTPVPFQRTGVKDLVTNKITWNKWQGPEGTKDGVYTVPAYQVSQKPGYDSYVNGKKASEVPAWSVTADSQNQIDTITYVKQSMIPVPYDPTNKDMNMSVTRVINYTVPEGHAAIPSVTQTVAYIRDGSKDPATGKITWNAWRAKDSSEFASTAVEQIKGYDSLVDGTKATEVPAAAVVVTDGVPQNGTAVTVTYTKAANTPVPYVPGKKGVNDNSNLYVTRTIKYIVPEGQAAIPDQVQTVHYVRKDAQGNSGYQDPTTGKVTYVAWRLAEGQKAEWPAANVNQIKGYDSLVDGKKATAVNEEAVTDVTKDVTVTVTYTKATNTPVPYVPGKKGVNDEMNKYVTRTIIVKVPAGQKAVAPIAQTVHFTNEDKDGNSGYKDPATGKITYNTNWHVVGNLSETTGTWNAYTAPTFKGYKAKPASIKAVTVSYDTPNATATINYVPEGSTPIKFNQDNKDMYREVVRTIVTNIPVAHAQTEYQKVAFTREDAQGNAGYKTPDGKVIMNNWHVVNSDNTTGTWVQYTAPTVAGYVASPETITAETVTANTKDTTVTINYTETDAHKYAPTGGTITVNKGTKLTNTQAAEGITNKGTLPKNTKYSWQSPVDTKTPGNKQGVVIVTYPDGSQTTVKVTVHVNDVKRSSDAGKYTPESQPIITNQGQVPEASTGIKNKGHMPAGTKYTWQDPAQVKKDISTPGDHPEKVIVTYPDKSKDTIIVPVIVKPMTQPITTKQGQVPAPSTGIKHPGSLPHGTTIKWQNPDQVKQDVEKPGSHSVTITVTYPGGSKVNVTVPITVKSTTINQVIPEGQPITTKQGVIPDPRAGIKNRDQLPAGTKYTWQDPTQVKNAVKTPGRHSATIVVTYPDGSKKTVNVTIIVPAPTGQPINTNKGHLPNPVNGIKNKGQMPTGTKYTWQQAPDVSTIGDHTGVIKVTFPDGTTYDTTVTVHVMNSVEGNVGNNNSRTGITNTKMTMQTTTNSKISNKNNMKTLPQTGNNTSSTLALLGLGLTSITTLLGFGKKRRTNK